MPVNHHLTLDREIHTEKEAKAAPSLEESTISEIIESEQDPSCLAATVHREKPELSLKWVNIISIGIFHAIAVYGVFVAITEAKLLTNLWAFLVAKISGIGITGGVHRLWSHRSYKANVPLRAILAILFSIAGQNTIYDWVRDHRSHHKYSETDADPHNANRGFFFAHVGWLMQRKHPDVIEKGRQVDMSDILNDPVVRFHNKHFVLLKLVFCFIIPSVVPHYCWNETWRVSLLVCLFTRYACVLNFTWLVNSAAHIWGSRPYDTQISPAENKFVAIVSLGEGWHNYHHVFPWDYKAAELGDYGFINFTTAFINFFSLLGWAYDLKVASPDVIKNRALRTGDGSWGTVGGEVIPELETTKEVDEYEEPVNKKQE